MTKHTLFGSGSLSSARWRPRVGRHGHGMRALKVPRAMNSPCFSGFWAVFCCGCVHKVVYMARCPSRPGIIFEEAQDEFSTMYRTMLPIGSSGALTKPTQEWFLESVIVHRRVCVPLRSSFYAPFYDSRVTLTGSRECTAASTEWQRYCRRFFSHPGCYSGTWRTGQYGRQP